MPTLELWDSFSKRANSTKRPASAGWTVNAALKEDTSLSNPTFILAAIPPIPSAVNYALFEGRYYFVTDIVQQSNHRYELKCKIDVMATYKDAIAAYNTFVERSASNFNTMLNDTLISQTANIVDSANADTSVGLDTNGMYLIRTVSENGIVGYLMNPNEYRRFIKFMFSANAYPNGEISDAVTKTFFNPFQYCCMLMWVPFQPPIPNVIGVADSPEDIPFGWWLYDAGDGGYPVPTGAHYRMVIGLNKPSRYYNDFRDFDDSWTQYSIYLPGIGVCSIAAAEMVEPLQIEMTVDFTTGGVTYILSNTEQATPPQNHIIAEYSGELGVQMEIGQLAVSKTGIKAVGAMGGSIGTAIGEWLGIGSGGNGFANLINAVKSLGKPTESIRGSAGNASMIKSYPNVTITRHTFGAAGIPGSVAGRPLYQYATLGSLSGFVKCGNASIEISGFSGERDAVNSMLNSGFYME